MRLTRKSWALCVVTTALAGCGSGVAPLGLHDMRLPLEARRGLADAEDEIAIAGAEHEEAEGRLQEARDFRRYTDRDVSSRWPNSAAARTARERLGDMARERIELARLQEQSAGDRIVLARRMLIQARAETAVRHDLAAHNLDPITASTGQARQTLESRLQQVEAQRARVDQATTRFWEAYGAYLSAGGRNDVLWSWEN